ncbi:hypothetical protein WN944_023915 [Citrus x changshan-huyou]|uniref:TPX2 C-terminal domain-containing protein n=1 Tax=Citrus x changshan-huyou TaxID=2935761 RepID=A0AAP0LT93_9ROSI
MEKARTKSALKFVKASSQSTGSWSSSANGMAKENTKPQEFTLHTQQRAVKRAMFNYSVATKLYLQELQKKRVEKLQKSSFEFDELADDRRRRDTIDEKGDDSKISVDASI